MIKTMLLSIMIYAAVCATPATAATGFESDFDLLWNITVSNSCSRTQVTYSDCRLVEKNLLWIAFIPDQNKVAGPHGRQIRVSLSGCTSIVMEEAD